MFAPRSIVKRLAAAFAEHHQLSKKQGLQMLEELIGMTTSSKKSERVKIAVLAILLIRKHAPRMGRKPMTGEAIKNQAEQESRLPCCSGFENGDLIVDKFVLQSPPPVGWALFLKLGLRCPITGPKTKCMAQGPSRLALNVI